MLDRFQHRCALLRLSGLSLRSVPSGPQATRTTASKLSVPGKKTRPRNPRSLESTGDRIVVGRLSCAG